MNLVYPLRVDSYSTGSIPYSTLTANINGRHHSTFFPKYFAREEL